MYIERWRSVGWGSRILDLMKSKARIKIMILRKKRKSTALGGIYQGRPAYLGEGDLGKLDIYCYFHRNSIVKPGQTGEGGLESSILPGRR